MKKKRQMIWKMKVHKMAQAGNKRERMECVHCLSLVQTTSKKRLPCSKCSKKVSPQQMSQTRQLTLVCMKVSCMC